MPLNYSESSFIMISLAVFQFSFEVVFCVILLHVNQVIITFSLSVLLFSIAVLFPDILNMGLKPRKPFAQ